MKAFAVIGLIAVSAGFLAAALPDWAVGIGWLGGWVCHGIQHATREIGT